MCVESHQIRQEARRIRKGGRTHFWADIVELSISMKSTGEWLVGLVRKGFFRSKWILLKKMEKIQASGGTTRSRIPLRIFLILMTAFSLTGQLHGFSGIYFDNGSRICRTKKNISKVFVEISSHYDMCFIKVWAKLRSSSWTPRTKRWWGKRSWLFWVSLTSQIRRLLTLWAGTTVQETIQ